MRKLADGIEVYYPKNRNRWYARYTDKRKTVKLNRSYDTNSECMQAAFPRRKLLKDTLLSAYVANIRCNLDCIESLI